MSSRISRMLSLRVSLSLFFSGGCSSTQRRLNAVDGGGGGGGAKGIPPLRCSSVVCARAFLCRRRRLFFGWVFKSSLLYLFFFLLLLFLFFFERSPLLSLQQKSTYHFPTTHSFARSKNIQRLADRHLGGISIERRGSVHQGRIHEEGIEQVSFQKHPDGPRGS